MDSHPHVTCRLKCCSNGGGVGSKIGFVSWYPREYIAYPVCIITKKRIHPVTFLSSIVLKRCPTLSFFLHLFPDDSILLSSFFFYFCWLCRRRTSIPSPWITLMTIQENINSRLCSCETYILQIWLIANFQYFKS